MNKELAAQFGTSIITLTILFFTMDVFSGDIEFHLQNIIPYFVSALIGTAVGVIYYQLIGFRFTKFQFISSVIPTVLFSVLITKSGLHHYWILNNLTLMVAFMMVVIYSLERKRKSL